MAAILAAMMAAILIFCNPTNRTYIGSYNSPYLPNISKIAEAVRKFHGILVELAAMLAAILTSKMAAILNFCKSANGAFIWSYDKHTDHFLRKSVKLFKSYVVL